MLTERRQANESDKSFHRQPLLVVQTYAAKGDYRAMICHLFLNKNEIPSVHKISEGNFNKKERDAVESSANA